MTPLHVRPHVLFGREAEVESNPVRSRRASWDESFEAQKPYLPYRAVRVPYPFKVRVLSGCMSDDDIFVTIPLSRIVEKSALFRLGWCMDYPT